ncbi:MULTISPECIES: hypothetical protein [unclassified Streptomyces]|uniref:hypothetical protein n=1 Tax=unclassified Streptomyces TaxID=2593676 RepID=UPI000823ACFA|nr:MULTISPECIES: hypothetical protein [unclassified Streptomyces]SCK25440.1 hypothetical protein YW7DRAFT_01943 [Streptomyces sp. AmelKG-E11A]
MSRIPDAVAVASLDTHRLIVTVPNDGPAEIACNLPHPVAAVVLRQIAAQLDPSDRAPAPDLYTYTDAQGHRLTIRGQDYTGQPLIQIEAEDPTPGGDITDVLLTPEQTRTLADSLDQIAAPDRHDPLTDYTGDHLTVIPGTLSTTLTVTCVDRELTDGPPTTVRVVVLAARLPEVRAAVMAAAGQAQRAAQTAEDAPSDAGWEARTDHAVRLYAETAIARDDALADAARLRTRLAALEATTTTPPPAGTALHARTFAAALRANAGSHGNPTYDYETGPGMHRAADLLDRAADKITVTDPEQTAATLAAMTTPAQRTAAETTTGEVREALAFNACEQSPALATVRDVLLDDTPRTPAQALAAAYVLLAAHTRELADLARQTTDEYRDEHGVTRSTRALLTGMSSIRKRLDAHADRLDDRAQS